MNLFGKKVEAPVAAVETAPAINPETKAHWWEIFSEVLRMSVDDAEALHRARDN